MPLIEIARNASLITNAALVSLIEILPPIVVAALSSSERRLTLRDVDVRAREFGRFEVTEYDLQIIVSASYSEQRNQNISERQQQIVQGIQDQKILPEGIKAYVWLVLPPAHYGEFST